MKVERRGLRPTPNAKSCRPCARPAYEHDRRRSPPGLQNPLAYIAMAVGLGVWVYAFLMSQSFVFFPGVAPGMWGLTLVSMASGFLFSLTMYGLIWRRKKQGTFEEHIQKQAARLERRWLSPRQRVWVGGLAVAVASAVGGLLTYYSVTAAEQLPYGAYVEPPPYIFYVAALFYCGALGGSVLFFLYGAYRLLTGRKNAREALGEAVEGLYFVRHRYVRGGVLLLGLLGGAVLLGSTVLLDGQSVGGLLLGLAVFLGLFIAAEIVLRRAWERGAASDEASADA